MEQNTCFNGFYGLGQSPEFPSFFIVVELAAGMVVGCKRMKREREKVDAIDIPITH